MSGYLGYNKDVGKDDGSIQREATQWLSEIGNRLLDGRLRK